MNNYTLSGSSACHSQLRLRGMSLGSRKEESVSVMSKFTRHGVC